MIPAWLIVGFSSHSYYFANIVIGSDISILSCACTAGKNNTHAKILCYRICIISGYGNCGSIATLCIILHYYITAATNLLCYQSGACIGIKYSCLEHSIVSEFFKNHTSVNTSTSKCCRSCCVILSKIGPF